MIIIYMVKMFLSSTWREIDPDTAYVVCISASLGFPLYGINMLHTLTRNANILDAAILWPATDAVLSGEPLLWRHIDMAIIVSPNTGGQCEFAVITGCRSIKY